MSADEKRKVVLQIYHTTQSVYTEKEILTLASKAGVNANTYVPNACNAMQCNAMHTSVFGVGVIFSIVVFLVFDRNYCHWQWIQCQNIDICASFIIIIPAYKCGFVELFCYGMHASAVRETHPASLGGDQPQSVTNFILYGVVSLRVKQQ